MGLWLAGAFLSWAFLLGAASATDASSCARENDEQSRERDGLGAEYMNTIVPSRAAGKRLPSRAPWKGGGVCGTERG